MNFRKKQIKGDADLMKIKNIMKKTAALILAAGLTVPLYTNSVLAAVGDEKISLGADLSEDQKAEVLRLLDITDLDDSEVIYVTNEEEHEYLDAYVSYDKIGDTALSSSKIILKDDGYGINVTTYNINYCTVGMYQSALATAGVKNADVYVAGPAKISGTAALVGIMKAYNTASDGSLNEENVEAATQELAVTSELGEAIDDPEKAEQIVAKLKEELDNVENMDDAAIDEKIKEVASELDVSLSDSEISSIRELLRKLGSLDIDWNSLLGQLKGLYEKYTSSNSESTDVNNILNNIGNFAGGIINKLSEIFKGLFG